MERLSRLYGVLVFVLLLGSAGADDTPVDTPPADAWAWFDAAELTVDGFGWPERARTWSRFPLAARDHLSDAAWVDGRAPAGAAVRFETDATELLVRWRLAAAPGARRESSERLAGGLDLYAREPGNAWRWLSGATPAPDATDHLGALAVGLPSAPREFLLYLPVLRGLEHLELGVPGGAVIRPAPALAEGREYPIVLWGGAALHGAGASRPGQTVAARLGRRLGRSVVGLGLASGSGVDLEAGALLSEVNAAAIVIDPVGSCTAPQLAADLAPFLQGLRAARPRTQILLVVGVTPPAVEHLPALAAEWDARRAALVAAYEGLQADGMVGLFLLADENLIGDDGEGTVDGYLPNDLGHRRYADALERALPPLLSSWERQRPGR